MNSFRKFTAALAALAVTMTSVFTFSVAVAATTFTDASGIASWASASITALADAGVLSGRPDGSFDPQGNLNRAEVAKVATLAAGLTEDTTGAPHFNDVAASDWFYSYVETLYNNGVVGGINGGALDSNGLATYNPGGTLNRAEGSKILVDAFDLETSYSGTPPNFPDVASSAWFYDYVETAYAHGIVNGYSSGDFGPGDAITREQIAVIAKSGVDEAADASKRRSDYTAGAASSVEPTDPVTPTTPASDGDLTVALSASSAAAQTFPQGASSTAVAAYDFTATSDDVTITNLVVKRTGVGTDGDWTLYIYDGEDRLTSGKTINSTSHEATFTGLSVTVAAGTTKTLTLKADTATSSTGGDSFFEIVAAESVTSNAQSVGGSFPVKSNKQEVNTAVSAGTITIIDTGSMTNPKVGEDNVTIAKFKLTTANEAGLVSQIALLVDGTISATDVQNAKLYQGTTLLASTAGVNSKDLLVFTLDTPFTIEKGDSRNFDVTADLNTGRGSDTTKFYLDEGTDLVATGGTYGFGMAVTSTGYDGGTCAGGSTDECNYTTLQGGDITITSSGPTATEVAVNSKDVVLMDFTIASVSEVTVKKFGIFLTSNETAGDDTDGGMLGVSDVSNYTDIKIINKDTGAVLMGPIDSTALKTTSAGSTAIAAATDEEGFYTFQDEFGMAAGEELNLALTADIANNTEAGFVNDTVYASLDLDNTSALEIKDINNKTITNASSVVPTSDITGKTMTVDAATLTTTKAATPVSDTFVKGTKGVELIGLSTAAGSASDIKITDIVIRLYGDTSTTFGGSGLGDTSANDLVSNIELWIDDVKIAGPEGLTLVDTTGGTFTADTDHYKATFDNMDYVVTAGSTKKITVKGDISSSLSATRYLAADIDPDADITAEDQDGNSVTDSTTTARNLAGSPSPMLTLATSGSITVAEEDSPNAGIIIGGAQGVTMGQYKFTAANEAQMVKDFTVEVTGTTDVTDVSVEYTDKDGTTVTSSSSVAGGVAAFKDETLYVAKDESSTLIIKGDLNTTAAGAVSGDSVKLSLGTNDITSFKAVGEGSGTTDTTLTPTGDTNTMIIRKTAPTIAKATGLSTTLTNGQNTIYGFTIAADAASAVSWRAAKVKLTGSIALDAGTISTFKFFRGTADLTDDVQVVIAVTTDGAGTVADDLESTTDYIVDAGGAFDLVAAVEWNDAVTSKETVSAGSSKTYYIKADVTGAATNDSISAYIADDTAAVVNVVATDLVAFTAANLKYVAATAAAAEAAAVGLIYDRKGDSTAVDGAVCANASDDITLGGTVSDCATVSAATIGSVKFVAAADGTGVEADTTSVFYDPSADSTAADGLVCVDTLADDILLTATTIADCGTIGAATATKFEIAVDGTTATTKVAVYHDKDGDIVAANGAVCTNAGATTSLLGGTAPTDCEFFTRLPYVAYPNLLWSDQSVTGHSTATEDWTNGYLVSDLATASNTLTK
jgi:hypothetical protein